jgi:hypothetical protein
VARDAAPTTPPLNPMPITEPGFGERWPIPRAPSLEGGPRRSAVPPVAKTRRRPRNRCPAAAVRSLARARAAYGAGGTRPRGEPATLVG